ncbi:MAG: methyltransferase domain-containing protein [Rhodobacteraceae bacterium]|nr:methyltransferase domain-containing protein [Paracoccaceae bacterium]
MPEVHPAATAGYSTASGAYAAGRPDYPAALAGWLTGPLGLGPGTTVLDLGAGTGKFTARLAATGARVIAVEPVAAMRARLAADLPGVMALEGTAQAIPLPDASLDALTCAQSFHWFATAAALTEIARVLKPGGRFGLIWNVRDEQTPWVAALTAIMAPHEGDAPRFHSGAWRGPFPDPRFSAMEEAMFEHAHSGPFASVVLDRIMSVSFIAALPAAAQDEVRAQIAALPARFPDLADPARVTFPYRTRAFMMTRA